MKPGYVPRPLVGNAKSWDTLESTVRKGALFVGRRVTSTGMVRIIHVCFAQKRKIPSGIVRKWSALVVDASGILAEIAKLPIEQVGTPMPPTGHLPPDQGLMASRKAGGDGACPLPRKEVEGSKRPTPSSGKPHPKAAHLSTLITLSSHQLHVRTIGTPLTLWTLTSMRTVGV